MSQQRGGRRSLFLIVCAFAVAALAPGLFDLGSGGAVSAQSGEAVQTTLLATPDDDTAEKIPVEGAEIVVYEAVVENRVIESVGEEVGRGTTDETGFVLVPLPGPGSYAVELQVDTLPEGVELVRADRQQLPIEARAGETSRVLFNLAEGGAASAARGKESDSLLDSRHSPACTKGSSSG